MSKPELGAGDIEVEIGGEKYTLKPSLGACMALTSDPAGLIGSENSLFMRIGKLDITVMARVIRLGLGVGAGALRDLEEKIYSTGLTTLVDPLQQFLIVVVNGGRLPGKEDEKKAGEDEAAPQADAT